MATQTATTLEHVRANRDSVWRCTARPGLWKVEKINAVNVRLRNVETGAGLNAHPSFLFLADGVLDDAPVVTDIDITPDLMPGTVIKFHPRPKAPTGLWVIVRDSNARGVTTYSVHPLGGSSRYYRGVRATSFVVIEPKDIADHI